MRARGLKHAGQHAEVFVADVAPHAGAWVETSLRVYGSGRSWSRPMRARGLKPQSPAIHPRLLRRAPCGRVG